MEENVQAEPEESVRIKGVRKMTPAELKAWNKRERERLEKLERELNRMLAGGTDSNRRCTW